MTTQTVEDTLLNVLETAFQSNKYELAVHTVRAIQALGRENDALFTKINKLPFANPVRGFFLHKMCLQETYVHFGDLNGLKEIYPVNSHFQTRDTSLHIGYGPALFECRVVYDKKSCSFKDDVDWGAKLHLKTIFYFGGDDNYPEGNYFRVYDPELHYNFLVQPNKRWLNPNLVPIGSLYPFKKELQNLKERHDGLSIAFGMAFGKDMIVSRE